MRWTTLRVALVPTTGCAKGQPLVAPTRHTFHELPTAESGVTERADGRDITIAAFNLLRAAAPGISVRRTVEAPIATPR